MITDTPSTSSAFFMTFDVSVTLNGLTTSQKSTPIPLTMPSMSTDSVFMPPKSLPVPGLGC